LLGGLGGVRLLLLASSDLLRRLLALLGCLTRRVLGLLSCAACGVLCLACDLTGLVGCLTGGVLRLLSCATCGVLCLARYLSCLIGGLPRDFLSLPGCLSGGVLHALGNLTHLVGDPAQGTSASLTFTLLLASAGETSGESPHGVLRLTRYLSCLVGSLACYLLGLPGCLSGRVLGLTRYLSCLVGGLPGYLLGLACRLPGGVLRLLGRFLRELLHLLHGLLGSLVHRFLDTRILGRLIHGALELYVGVDHLLDLGLLVAFGELLSVLLQLFAVTLSLALDPTQRLPVEVLGVLHGLLLHLLL
jgi:hypothetical protein